MNSLHGIEAIVTDIEGTTSALSFVKEVLFPYAEAALPDFVRAHAHEPELRAILEEVRTLEANPALDTEGAIATLLAWARADKKITPLKSLQGMIWQEGYEKGGFTGHLYEDAFAVLAAWHKRGIRLYVYSSGSVPAQKLLFSHTPYGDLTPLFSGYFDTTIGGKLEADSYRKIAGIIGLSPASILFLSDHAGELDAAKQAGVRTIHLDRENEGKVTEHASVRDFWQIEEKATA